MKFEVRRLEEHDDRTEFRSDNADLDRFFVRFAGQNQFRHHIGTTYVAVDTSGWIAGFLTVTMSAILPAHLPASLRVNLPNYPVPVLRIARLAVDVRARNLGIGRLLFGFAHQLAKELAVTVGCFGVVVDAKLESITFYEKLGFEALDARAGLLNDKPGPLPMFVDLKPAR